MRLFREHYKGPSSNVTFWVVGAIEVDVEGLDAFKGVLTHSADELKADEREGVKVWYEVGVRLQSC